MLRAVLAGEAAAFGTLVERHHAALLRVLIGIVGDSHLAEDVAQEVWLLVYRKLGSFQFRSRFSTWLFRVAVREASSAKNRLRRFVARHVALSARHDPADRTVDADGGDVGRETVLRALAWLPTAERAAFALHVEGLRYDEIAQALACPAGTVATRIKRAREKLAAWLPAAVQGGAGHVPRSAESKRMIDPSRKHGDSATASEVPR